MTAWIALFGVKAEEAERARDAAESPDGQVVVHGLERGGDEDDDEDGHELTDGEAE